MKLLIVESPSKAKTIEKYLGKEYTVRASVGHVRDLPKSNKDAIDVEGGFVPRYEISPGKEKVLAGMKKLVLRADDVMLATDPDREGEAIAWHIKEALKLKNPKRVVFNEITQSAVQAAVANPRDIDEDLRKAQEARRVLDRLVGYDLSGLIWKKVRFGLSAGRVQSPALRILVEREREIRAFMPEDFWVLQALLETPRKEQVLFTCTEEPKTKDETDRILKVGRAGNWHVLAVEESEMARKPKAPFTTSTLQQSASSRLGMSPSRTMRVAQKLYEKGLISYMRTDSTNLSEQALGEIAAVITKSFGASYLEARHYKTKSKTAQEAHEAIRPTHVSDQHAGTTDEEKKLYKLIWQRTVASQMKDAKLLKTKIVANVDSGTIPDFAANGSRVLFDGWLKADPHARGEDVELPKVTKDEALKLIELMSEAKQTQPPNRYSEAGLVKELEKRGIGRPSTYAAIIQTLVTRQYVEKIDRSLKPTEVGEIVSGFLEEHFANIISDSFTAGMEDELDDIANGKRDYAQTLKAFYTPFAKQVAEKSKLKKATDLGAADPGMKCPACGKEMIIKLGKSGKFLSCTDFPACTGALTMEGKVMEGPKLTGEDCPVCTKGKLVEREGRFGKFVSCNRYPKCKHIKKDAEIEGEAPKHTGVGCPKCKTGFMQERRGRFGIFYSCTNYPTCKYAIKAKPTGNICGHARESGPCPELMMEGTKTIPERCSDKLCPNHNPHKLS
ncbi:MAG: DNA topoisomerase I [Parcubacteria group bacterium RIFOXYD2_FULL_52_8]|nr:MAG: DNA topoisomerase I [Parcubacteria group bacterium RIFOXYD2_FULL_52_8]